MFVVIYGGHYRIPNLTQLFMIFNYSPKDIYGLHVRLFLQGNRIFVVRQLNPCYVRVADWPIEGY